MLRSRDEVTVAYADRFAALKCSSAFVMPPKGGRKIFLRTGGLDRVLLDIDRRNRYSLGPALFSNNPVCALR